MRKLWLLILSVLDFYRSFFLVWLFNRKLQSRTDLILWGSKSLVSLFPKKTAITKSLREFFLSSSESSSRFANIMIRLRFLIFPVFALWPIISFFITIKNHRKDILLQWRVIISRPDLLFFVGKGPYREQEIEQLLSCMLHIVYTIFLYNHEGLTEFEIDQKPIFYQRAKECSLPVVTNLSKEQLIEIIDLQPEKKLILKPSSGMQGKGISIIPAKKLKKEEIDTQEIIYQEALSNLPEIRKIVGDTAGFCTLRMITYVIESEFRVLGSFFRLARQGYAVDNFHSGGVAASVDSNGILQRGTINEDKFDSWQNFSTILLHPDTGVEFVGLQLPFYSEIKQLCCHAHEKLAPNAFLIGFDVAITNKGPLLVEANILSGVLELLLNPDSHAYWNELIKLVNTRCRNKVSGVK